MVFIWLSCRHHIPGPRSNIPTGGFNAAPLSRSRRTRAASFRSQARYSSVSPAFIILLLNKNIHFSIQGPGLVDKKVRKIRIFSITYVGSIVLTGLRASNLTSSESRSGDKRLLNSFTSTVTQTKCI